jgi:dihydrofolate reductase
MSKVRVSAIAAISAGDRGLGKDNNLLWRIPEDMKHFRSLTMGHPVITGRKNFESMSRALPGRVNIIVTRDHSYRQENCIVVHSIEEAIQKGGELDEEEVFIIGGGEIYKAALPYTDRLYLTLIEGEKEADIFFPEYPEFTKKISEEKGAYEGTSYSFVTLERA